MKIFGMGTVVEDHVIQLREYPEADHKIPLDHHWRQIGGPIPVALSIAARFGAETAFCGRWGKDHAGHNIEETLKSRGVDLSLSRSHDEWESGFAHVWCDVEAGTRTIAYSRGHTELPQPGDLPEAVLANFEILHTDGWAAEAAIAVAKIIKAGGGMVVLDAGSVKPGLSQLLPLVDIVIASSLFRRDYFGTDQPTKEQLRSLKATNVVTTDGDKGCRWLTGDEEIAMPAISIDVVDSNGAGDVFCGALLYAISEGWVREKSLAFANAVAGLSCGKPGNYPPADIEAVHRILGN